MSMQFVYDLPKLCDVEGDFEIQASAYQFEFTSKQT